MESTAGPLIDVFSRLWDCSAVGTNYLCDLEKNVNSLKSSLIKLRERRDDVNQRVDMAEGNPAEPVKRTHEVSGWLGRVAAFEQQVDRILDKAANKEGGSYFCCWGRKNCCSGYKLGKSVAEKMTEVEKLWEQGNFSAVAEKYQPAPVQELTAEPALGIESNIEEVWNLLADETSPVRIIGLYGMGGVGKTTLLKKVNNKFLERSHHFDKVIWVVVSKDRATDIINIQKQIGESFGYDWSGKTNIDERARLVSQVLKNKRFVLLLDDIWERINLATVGIPNVKDDTEKIISISRVVFTTRSELVCGLMEADKNIKVYCLQWDKAWSLFQEKVGLNTLNCHQNIPELAVKVAEECRGLPLALITIGRTMASKTTIEQWKYAITVLQKSASEYPGVADVLTILKFSYDSLEKKLKSCFVYCSLYPEDYSIKKEELIRLWIGEGFLDEADYIDGAYNDGHSVIESLKSASLLESGDEENKEVKMHDVVRDLAIWISSDLGTRKGKFLSVSANKEFKLQEWENAEKISLVGNESIKELNGAPDCPNLSTLLLHSTDAETISDDFFQHMPKLQVLDISNSDVIDQELPTSICSLTELRCLFLSDSKFQMGPVTFVCLTKLKMLDLFDAKINWEEQGEPSLRELESLKDLKYLGICLRPGFALRRLLNSHKFQLCTESLKIESWEKDGITTLALSPSHLSSPSIVSLANMGGLKRLDLSGVDDLEELRIEDKVTQFTNLKILTLRNLPKLEIVWDVPHRPTTFCFVNLKNLEIAHCPKLKDLSWLIYARNIETLILRELYGLEEVISDRFASDEKSANTFQRLRSFQFWNMPKLKRICSPDVRFLSLELIQAVVSPELKKLPFDMNSIIPNTLKEIKGSKIWQEWLQWEDETTKSNLAHLFRD